MAANVLRRPITKFPVSDRLAVPGHIPRPGYVSAPVPSMGDSVTINDASTIAAVRTACQLAGKMRAFAGAIAKPGMTTDTLDKIVHDEIIKHNAYPSPLGYSQFPKSICTSLNEVILHGIPDTRPLENGDILKIDVSVYKDGVHGDCCGTFLVGNVDEKGRKLVEGTREALERSIAVCRPGVPVKEIGRVISRYASKHGWSVVRRFTGHGLGRNLHMYPHIYHCNNDETAVMLPGMIFTIEPALTEGSADCRVWESDGWTVVTTDGSRAAQFEEALLITEHGHEILTRVDAHTTGRPEKPAAKRR